MIFIINVYVQINEWNENLHINTKFDMKISKTKTLI